ncbi:hypothetical protein [Kitasatospora sp. McL0602]|uniref:hypothetical protein n=1 Tax=Kitasatospora sp. McL0602 TaxID=3439530 RepID=UPI003F8CD9C5
MFEYELIKQRNAELQQAAQRDRLVREALAGRSGSRVGLLSRIARSVRPVAPAGHRVPRLSEC